MNSMPPNWRFRWCESRACGCLGCANRSGGLISKGSTKQDWKTWKKNNVQETRESILKWTHGFVESQNDLDPEMKSDLHSNLWDLYE